MYKREFRTPFMLFKTSKLQKSDLFARQRKKETKRRRCMNDVHLNIYLSGDSLDPRQIT